MRTFVVIVLVWTTVSLALGGVWGWAHLTRRQGAPTPLARARISVPAPRTARSEQPAHRV